MEAPKVGHDIREFLWDIAEWMVKNLFGLLSALAGFVYQVSVISGKYRTMTKVQIVSSLIMSIVASVAMVVGLSKIDMNRLLYGFICWCTPFVIKQIADIISIRISPFTEKMITAFEKLIEKKSKSE